MSTVNITINGDIIINSGTHAPTELESVIKELAEAVIEGESANSEENRDDGFTVAFIVPDEIKTIALFEDCADFIDEMENGCEFQVEGEDFNLIFERKGLMTFFDECFLILPAFALFHDEQNRPVSANPEMLEALEDYIRENSTEFRFGDKVVVALRLEGEIIEGV